VDRHIRGGTLVRYPLHLYWHAYQTGRSVETAVHRLVYKIETTLEDGPLALGAFEGNTRAFDTTTSESMCRQPKSVGWGVM
jgi:hypothetical protein